MFWLKTCVSSSSRAKKALNETLNYQFLCTLYGFEPPFFPRTFCKKIYFLNVIRIVVFVTLSFRCCTMLLYWRVIIDGLDEYITFVYNDIWLWITESQIWFGVDLSNHQKSRNKNTSISTFSNVCKTCERIRIRVIAKLLLFNGCNMSTVFVDLLPISLQWVYLDNYGSKHPNY